MAKKDKKQKQQKIMKQKTKSKKGAKKSFFEVSAPITSTKIMLYSASPSELDGKVVKLDLSRSLRGKSLELRMRIKAENDSLTAEPFEIKLASSYIVRAMRRGTDYAEDSFIVECKDALVRVKPLLITRRRVSRAVLNSLRQTARKNLEVYIKTRTSKEIFEDIMANKIQKQLATKLKKIYPLALCEIRHFNIEKTEEK